MVTVYRNKAALDEVADECRKAGSPDVLVAPHDLAEEQECIKAVEETVEHFGGKSSRQTDIHKYSTSWFWQKMKKTDWLEAGDSEMNKFRWF